MNPENTPLLTPVDAHSKLKSFIKEVFIFGIMAICVLLFRFYVAEPYVVDGASMDPTFHTGDYLIVDKLSYELGSPKRNTVIVFKYPNAPLTRNWLEKLLWQPASIHTNFIKRVIGLPGDTVTMVDNKLTITNEKNKDGFSIDQSYVFNVCETEKNNCISSFTKTLGTDEYFVMGDNRSESYDSRYWGVLEKKYMLGKPVLQLWPVGKISILPGNDTK